MLSNFLKLQNGTDIRGIAVENEKFEVNLTCKTMEAISLGILKWLEVGTKNSCDKFRIAVGMDSRISGPEIKATMIEAFKGCGVNVIDCNMATTPAMFMTTVMEDYSCTAGIMITASHLPYFHNGVKVFTKKGGAEKTDITQILTFAAEMAQNCDIEENQGRVTEANLIEDYSRVLVYRIMKETGMSRPLDGLNVIVDAGNGAGGFFATKVLSSLGADISGSQFLEPDGMFPNHQPNPENKEAMESISKAVISKGADLGIIFDTDVDRAAVVSDDGKEINRNSLIALIGDIILREHPESIIVTDSITSTGLTEFINARGGKHHRFKRGYKNVINEAKRINEDGEGKSYLAIETSGHAALEENYFLDDGAYLIAKILVEVSRLHQEGKKIQSLIEDLKQPAESAEYRLKIKSADFAGYGKQVLESFEAFAKNTEGFEVEVPNHEGVKLTTENGWCLLRMSLHEPVMPLNIESDVEGGVQETVEKLKKFIDANEGLEF
ncbi:MAG: phosphomannomutase/phosphoglucomutase [Proteocatella sp.]